MQSAAVSQEDGAGDIESQPEGVSAGLEGAEEVVWVGHPGAGIVKVDGYQIALDGGGDADLAARAPFERLHAVAGEVDEDLQEAVMIGLHQGQAWGESQTRAMPASCRLGSITMRASSSTVPRSATAASRLEAARSPEEAIFPSPSIRVPSTRY